MGDGGQRWAVREKWDGAEVDEGEDKHLLCVAFNGVWTVKCTRAQAIAVWARWNKDALSSVAFEPAEPQVSMGGKYLPICLCRSGQCS